MNRKQMNFSGCPYTVWYIIPPPGGIPTCLMYRWPSTYISATANSCTSARVASAMPSAQY